MSSAFYITTPIYYVTDVPHLGHAYTTVVADSLARYHRLRGQPTGFLTGTDEHGQKIARMAEERGQSPQDYADQIAASYRATWQTLHISNDDFIRTTDADHKAVVQETWKKLLAKGDIYLGHYEGWYCVACEQFYTEKELAPAQHCPIHQRPVEQVKEPSYYFRLSKYEKPLLDLYEKNPHFIRPLERRNEVLAFVRQGLQDLSVSRTTFTWGVPVPDVQDHVIYVWIDALSNYYSATLRPALHGRWNDGVQIVHLIGKEISRFHAVYWPAMLMAAGLRLPDTIFCHGWWTVDGQKMSKTRGNVVDPNQLSADLGADAFRYFVLREIPLGADGDFSHEAILQRYNAELANDLGNLLSRTFGMLRKYFPDGKLLSTVALENDLQKPTEQAVNDAAAAMEAFQPSLALEHLWKLIRECNAYIDKSAPWGAPADRRATILANIFEALRELGSLLDPFMPERAAELRRQLDRPELGWPTWSLTTDWPVATSPVLFPRIDDDRKKELLAKWTKQVA